MDSSPSTCWSLIRDAAEGHAPDRAAFALRYGPVARATLEARWRGAARRGDVEDAVQEVLVECLRAGGVLERARANEVGGFRAFLHGVILNVARRFESDEARRAIIACGGSGLDRLDGAGEPLSEAFDRAYARALLQEALEALRANALTRGGRAPERLELLRLRFEEGLPIRVIAARFGREAPFVQREYLAARLEFKEALLGVLRAHRFGSEGGVESGLRHLRAILA